MMIPILPIMLILPLAGMLTIMLSEKKYSNQISMGTCFAIFLFSLGVLYVMKFGDPSSLAFTLPFISQLSLTLSLTQTSYTLPLLLMSITVFLAASMVGKYFIGENERMYNVIFLFALLSSLGVFMASNLVFLYIFWEIAEVAMFFIIFLYGGYNRRYASIKFIIYSLVSSLLFLIALLLLYSVLHTFDITTIIAFASSIPTSTQLLVLALFMVSFMIKMPVFPLHTWLPDAHTEAPTTGSMILAGVLLKFGGYGLLLMFMMLPIASSYTSYILLIFTLSVVYSSFVSLKQTNMKRMIAYTSVTDMAVVGVGIASMNVYGYHGAVYLMVGHGLAISLLFLVAGTVDELYGTLEIGKVKGVVKNFPSVAYLFIIGAFAALGLPLTAGFVADLMVFIGSFNAFGVFGLISLIGILLIGAALFWLAERSFLNSSRAVMPYNFLDRNVVLSGLLLVAVSVLFGILPFLFGWN